MRVANKWLEASPRQSFGDGFSHTTEQCFAGPKAEGFIGHECDVTDLKVGPISRIRKLSLDRQLSRAWHRARIREELQERRVAASPLHKLIETSDALFSIHRA